MLNGGIAQTTNGRLGDSFHFTKNSASCTIAVILCQSQYLPSLEQACGTYALLVLLQQVSNQPLTAVDLANRAAHANLGLLQQVANQSFASMNLAYRTAHARLSLLQQATNHTFTSTRLVDCIACAFLGLFGEVLNQAFASLHLANSTA